jgi:hypothetical protein
VVVWAASGAAVAVPARRVPTRRVVRREEDRIAWFRQGAVNAARVVG